MTRADLIKILAEKSELTKNEVTLVLDNLAEVIKEEVYTGGDTIVIAGLGSFKQKKVNPRKARNPKTGESIDVPAKTKVVFAPVALLKN